MKLFGFNITRNQEQAIESPKSVVYQNDIVYGHSYPLLKRNWDGEKTLGELGNVYENIPNFNKLRLRSYDAYTTIDTVKIIASKFFYMIIGNGLKLQSEPNRTVLKSEGIENDDDEYTEFQKIVEARFLAYSNSKECDYLKEKTLGEIALEAYKMEFLGGDCLIICRVDEKGVNVQLISGEHICNPPIGSEYYESAKKSKNSICHGIEVDEKGSHVAYYVKVKSEKIEGEYKRILAYGKQSKRRMAWLLSGNKVSPDHLRSVPAMSQSLEKINKLDRYTEASVVKAEQAAKIVYTIEHQEYSTGENPLTEIVNKKRGGLGTTVSTDSNSDKVIADGLANRITETTSGMTFNLPNGAALKSFQTDIEGSFSDFFSTIFKSISAGVDLPPEVAMQEYNSNYSASRAAINSFDYVGDVKRNSFAMNFYVPFYELWLEHQILSNKIVANGYIENRDNFMVTKSYSQCRFTGKNTPHIDPLKEVKAIELMLKLNLISREQASEMLGVGQWDENYLKWLEEGKIVKPIEDKDENKTNTNE